jgi:hypothetical protein
MPSLFLERFNPTVRYDLMGHVLFDIVDSTTLFNRQRRLKSAPQTSSKL